MVCEFDSPQNEQVIDHEYVLSSNALTIAVSLVLDESFCKFDVDAKVHKKNS